MNIQIYHNPRCSKSRATLQLLIEAGHAPEVVDYLEQPPTKQELKKILIALGMASPRELMRTGQAEYKEQNLGAPHLTEDALLTAMVQTPILIERPIVLAKGQAKIGRPPESVLAIL